MMSLLKDSNTEWRRDLMRAQHLHPNPYYGSLGCLCTLANLFVHKPTTPEARTVVAQKLHGGSVSLVRLILGQAASSFA